MSYARVCIATAHTHTHQTPVHREVMSFQSQNVQFRLLRIQHIDGRRVVFLGFVLKASEVGQQVHLSCLRFGQVTAIRARAFKKGVSAIQSREVFLLLPKIPVFLQNRFAVESEKGGNEGAILPMR